MFSYLLPIPTKSNIKYIDNEKQLNKYNQFCLTVFYYLMNYNSYLLVLVVKTIYAVIATNRDVKLFKPL